MSFSERTCGITRTGRRRSCSGASVLQLTSDPRWKEEQLPAVTGGIQDEEFIRATPEWDFPQQEGEYWEYLPSYCRAEPPDTEQSRKVGERA